MNAHPTSESDSGISMATVIEVQDQLLCAGTELDRLQRLLTDAVVTLMQCVGEADATLRATLGSGDEPARRALASLGRATKALQFEDMASQLVAYTRQRLLHCADRLANGAMPGDDGAGAVVRAAPDRLNPVVQDEMDTGLVELF